MVLSLHAIWISPTIVYMPQIKQVFSCHRSANKSYELPLLLSYHSSGIPSLPILKLDHENINDSTCPRSNNRSSSSSYGECIYIYISLINFFDLIDLYQLITHCWLSYFYINLCLSQEVQVRGTMIMLKGKHYMKYTQGLILSVIPFHTRESWIQIIFREIFKPSLINMLISHPDRSFFDSDLFSFSVLSSSSIHIYSISSLLNHIWKLALVNSWSINEI